MAFFDRMKTSYFKPKGEPKREVRVGKSRPLSDQLQPTIDERTATAAREILENNSFIRVHERLRNSALHDFTQSGDGEEGTKKRERAYEKIRVLDDIKAEIEAYADQTKLHRRATVEK